MQPCQLVLRRFPAHIFNGKVKKHVGDKARHIHFGAKDKTFWRQRKKRFGAITMTRQNLNNLSSYVWAAIGDTGHLVGNGHLSLRYGEEKLVLHA